MSQEPEPPKEKPVVNYAAIVTVGAQVGLATLGFIFLALFIGLGLDKLFGTTKHPFTIILILGSVPVSLVVTYWLAMRAAKDLQPGAAVKKQTGPEEEKKRD
jgi:biotin transporter BioY